MLIIPLFNFNIDMFNKTNDVSQGKIRFINNRSLNAEGVRCIVLKDYDGRKIIIDDVLHVLGLKTNLMSLKELLQNGFFLGNEAEWFEYF